MGRIKEILQAYRTELASVIRNEYKAVFTDGGVLLVMVLAIFIYSMIAYTWGTTYIPFKNAYAGMEYCQSAKEIGFRDGDIPLTADGADLGFMSSE